MEDEAGAAGERVKEAALRDPLSSASGDLKHAGMDLPDYELGFSFRRVQEIDPW